MKISRWYQPPESTKEYFTKKILVNFKLQRLGKKVLMKNQEWLLFVSKVYDCFFNTHTHKMHLSSINPVLDIIPSSHSLFSQIIKFSFIILQTTAEDLQRHCCKRLSTGGKDKQRIKVLLKWCVCVDLYTLSYILIGIYKRHFSFPTLVKPDMLSLDMTDVFISILKNYTYFLLFLIDGYYSQEQIVTNSASPSFFFKARE